MIYLASLIAQLTQIVGHFLVQMEIMLVLQGKSNMHVLNEHSTQDTKNVMVSKLKLCICQMELALCLVLSLTAYMTQQVS